MWRLARSASPAAPASAAPTARRCAAMAGARTEAQHPGDSRNVARVLVLGVGLSVHTERIPPDQEQLLELSYAAVAAPHQLPLLDGQRARRAPDRHTASRRSAHPIARRHAAASERLASTALVRRPGPGQVGPGGRSSMVPLRSRGSHARCATGLTGRRARRRRPTRGGSLVGHAGDGVPRRGDGDGYRGSLDPHRRREPPGSDDAPAAAVVTSRPSSVERPKR